MRRFGTDYVVFKHKRLEYSQRKLLDFLASKGQILPVSGVSLKAVEASYKVSLNLNKAGTSHAIRVLTANSKSRYGHREAKRLVTTKLRNGFRF
jgi:hypothetical protein